MDWYAIFGLCEALEAGLRDERGRSLLANIPECIIPIRLGEAIYSVCLPRVSADYIAAPQGIGIRDRSENRDPSTARRANLGTRIRFSEQSLK